MNIVVFNQILEKEYECKALVIEGIF